MFIAKAPLRISFLGGGTDFPWFFEHHDGAVVSAAVNRSVYLVATYGFDPGVHLLRYSRSEVVSRVEKIRHPILREAFVEYLPSALDLSVHADLPSGNGLGSSSAFTVGTIALLEKICFDRSASASNLASKAIAIELDRLHEPIGIQDQLASAFGGLRFYEFSSGRAFTQRDLLGLKTFPFQMGLLKIGTPAREASKYTALQADHVRDNLKAWEALRSLAKLTREAGETLDTDLSLLPEFLSEAWKLKKASNPSASSDEVETLLSRGLRHGALAGKVLGAGGGGFLMLLSQDLQHLQAKLKDREGLDLLEVSIEEEGARAWEI